MQPSEFFKGSNIITPTVIECGWIIRGKMAYELSRGTGIKEEPIFGVTISEHPGDWGNQYSSLKFTLEEAKDYIQSLKEEMRGIIKASE